MRGSDIIQGITAFSAMSNALKGDPHKDMYSYLMRRQQMMDKAYKEAYARGAAGQPMGYPSAGGMTANAGGAMTTGLMGGGGTPGYLPGDGGSYSPDTSETYSQGGMVPHFQGGGIEAINTAGEPQSDPLFETVNQAAPPPEDPRWSPQGDIASANAIDEVRRRRAAMAAGGAGALGASAGAGIGDVASRASLENAAPPPGEDTPPPQPPTSSPVGRLIKPLIDATQGGVEKRRAARERLGKLLEEIKPFGQQTEAERIESQKRIDELLKEPAIDTSPRTSQGAAPPGAPAAGAPSVATPAANAGRPNAGLPGSQDIRGIDRFLQPAAGPGIGPDFRGAAAAPVGPAAPAARTSTGVSPQAAAGAGTNTPGGMAAAPVPSPVPGALSDQNRTAAFNPATEQGIGAVDASGQVVPKPQMLQAQAPQPGATNAAAADSQRPGNLSSNNVMDDFKSALDGAHKGALMSMQQKGLTPQQVQSGVGAASPRATNAILHRFGGNGRLTPGEAMVAGMTHVYAKALEMGDVAKANQMAFAIVQRANLEASVNGKAAIAALHGGDLKKGTEMMIRGHDWLPDGVRINMAPDGKSVIATDLEGKHQQLPLDGRWVMQAAMGLQDGSAMWNMINQHAAMVAQGAKGADRDAAGRALRNQKTGLEIERLRRKMAAPTGGGSAAPSVMSRIQEALSGKPAATPQTIHVNVDRDE